MTIYRLSRIAWLFCLALIMAGCSSDEISSPLPDDGEIKPGDPVMFTTHLPGKGQTRTIEPDGNFTGYSAAENGYSITIEMYKSDGTKIGNDGNYITANNDGTLVVAPSRQQLYWPDNTQAYGFKATAGTTTLVADQDTKEDFLRQDRLEGYAFVPLKNGETRQYTEDALNYMTSKEWKDANVTFGEEGDNQKKIPLYLNHKRSRITVILKAGDGVRPEELAFSTASTNIAATIYSYSGESKTEIKPYASDVTVDYGQSTQYTAIVEKHNYSSQDIVTINLSGQSVTFKGSYDISEEGKHLILTLTLSRDNSFQVLGKAQVTNWEDVGPTSVTLDDLGQSE